ncbi:MAG: chemotaxis protein CheW [Actinomycetota bacterium]
MQAQTVANSIEAFTNPEGTTNQYLTFMLGEEEFGVDILRVQEIKGWEPSTAIPNTPEYIRGVMNLRGTVVPIVDLRLRFELDSADYSPTTVVIVLKVEGDHSTRTMGFVVDAVSEVYNVGVEQLQPAPEFGSRVNTAFIRSLAVIEDKMLILLDFDCLIGLDSAFSAIENADNQQPTDTNPRERTE